MQALVTGAAGFIGSHLVDGLLAEGWEVRGVDDFKPYYPRACKQANLADALRRPGFRLIEADLASADLSSLLDGVTVVLHAAAQPGVRGSWEDGFDEYVRNNVLATQRLLEAVRLTDIRRFVFSSSSSVYGNAERLPATETDPTSPFSPYGVTKLAAEHLCSAYAANWGVPVLSLRYFTVYGPRQRPDMAIHRLIQAGLSGSPFPLFGTGAQLRDFTYVGDVVDANLASIDAPLEPGTVINVGGGSTASMNQLIEEVGELLGLPVPVARQAEQPGDVRDTYASIELARRTLGWTPGTPRLEGLRRQIDWHLGPAGRGDIPVRRARTNRSEVGTGGANPG